MSLESVKAFFAARQADIAIIELDVSTATVAEAASAHGVEPGRIAKTLAFRLNDGRDVILVARGDAASTTANSRTPSARARCCRQKRWKPSPATLSAASARSAWPRAAHLPGRVHPGLRRSAAGRRAVHSAVRISPEALGDITAGQWVDVCQAFA
ncbi:Uncharacterized conserved protein [Chromobacterium violaceum]|uniref:Uncharacterized conserved protein n=1 Tax=Chromobacterium violaceum TaxID=536 RepID=A0A3S4JWC7_CHRVL|nr:Uncharacterized conserved protein [Chromobacterium violaceum]